MSASRDFWLSCGHHLLDRDATGKLLVTDEFLKAYFARPELMPPAEACSAERGLHNAQLQDPRQPIAVSRIAAIADTDARENWQVMIAWRDHLAKHRSLDDAYLDIVRCNIRFPHIFIGQLVQAILRNALDDCDDVFMLRAAEMFFRPQKLVPQQASIVEATRIGGAIWHGGDLGDVARDQLVGLFRVTFRDAVDTVQEIRGELVCLLMAMAADTVLRLKPQNLITGLPIRYVEAFK